MAKRSRKNAADDLDKLDIVNPSDADGNDLFLMWFGAYRDGRVLVWAGSFDDAFEIAVDHFDDTKSCGVFTFTDEGDYKAAAADEGIEWPAGGWDDLSDSDQEKIREAAEADLTVIGHTTLSCMPKGAWGAFVASHEWGGDDVTGEDRKVILAKSLAMNEDQAQDLLDDGWSEGEEGSWHKEFKVDGQRYNMQVLDQEALLREGGDGKHLLIAIYADTLLSHSKKFEDVRDVLEYAEDFEDRMREKD